MMGVNHYDLSTFSPQEFERLIQTLLVELCGAQLEVFGSTSGADGGRDAVYQGDLQLEKSGPLWRGYTVIQCKFRESPDNNPQKDGRWLMERIDKEFKAFTATDSRRKKPEYYLLATNIALSGTPGNGSKDKVDRLLAEKAALLSINAVQVWDSHKLSVLLNSAPKTRQSFQTFFNLSDYMERQQETAQKIIGETFNTRRIVQRALNEDGINHTSEWFTNWPEDGSLPYPKRPPNDSLIATSYVEREIDRTVRGELFDGACVGVTGFVGMGGIGKTFLAMYLANDFLNDGGRVVWVGLLRSSLENAMDAFANVFGLSFRHGLTVTEKLTALQAILEYHKRRQTRLLVVLDNAERFTELPDLVELCRGYAAVLVTSRQYDFNAGVKYHRIDAMSGEEAEAMCRTYLDVVEVQYGGYKRLSRAEKQELALLCNELGGHPLGIRLALRGLVRERGVGRVSRLRQRIKDHPIDQLHDEESRESSLSCSVRNTFDMLYQDLPESEGETGLCAQVLLPVIAALAPTPLPKEEVAVGVASLCAVLDESPISPPPWEIALHKLKDCNEALDAAIEMLLDNALLDMDHSSEDEVLKLKVHPLLREYAFHRLESASTSSTPATGGKSRQLRTEQGPTSEALTDAVLRSTANLSEAVEIHLDLMPRLRRQTDKFTGYWSKLNDVALQQVFITGLWDDAVRLWQGFYEQVKDQGLPNLELQALAKIGERLLRMEDAKGWDCLAQAIALWQDIEVQPFQKSPDLAWYQTLAMSNQDLPLDDKQRRAVFELFETGLAQPNFIIHTETLYDLSVTAAHRAGWHTSPWITSIWGIASTLLSNHVNDLAGILEDTDRLPPEQLMRIRACYQFIMDNRSSHPRNINFHVTPKTKIYFRSSYALHQWRQGEIGTGEMENEFNAIAALAKQAGFRGHTIQFRSLSWNWEQAVCAGQWEAAEQLAAQAAEAALAADPHKPYLATIRPRCWRLLCRLAGAPRDTTDWTELAQAVTGLKEEICRNRDKYSLPWILLAEGLLAAGQGKDYAALSVQAYLCARTGFRHMNGEVPLHADYFFKHLMAQVDTDGPLFEALRDKLTDSVIDPWRDMPLLNWDALPQRVRCTRDGRTMRLVQGGWQAGPPPMNNDDKTCDIALYPFYIDEEPCSLPVPTEQDTSPDTAPRLLFSYQQASDLAAASGKRLPNRAEWAAWVWQQCLGNRPLTTPSPEDLLRRIEARVYQGITVEYPFPTDITGPYAKPSYPKNEQEWLTMRTAWLEQANWQNRIPELDSTVEQRVATPLRDRGDLTDTQLETFRLGLLNTLSLNFAETRRLLEGLSQLSTESITKLIDIFTQERTRLCAEVPLMNAQFTAALRARSVKWLAIASDINEADGVDIQQFWLLSPANLKENRLCANVTPFIAEQTIHHWPLAENLISELTAPADAPIAAVRCVRPVFELNDMADLEPLADQPTMTEVFSHATQAIVSDETPSAHMPPLILDGKSQSVLSSDDELEESDFVTGGDDHSFIRDVLVPPHPTSEFDEQLFMELLANSISLSRTEKQRIIDSIPNLSQYQIDELMRIFTEEARKFAELNTTHQTSLQNKIKPKTAEEIDAPPTNNVQSTISTVIQSPLSMEEELQESDFVTGGDDHSFIRDVPVPPHPNTKFDEHLFMELLAGSISLTRQEKQRIAAFVPNMSQFQIDELIRIFTTEAGKLTSRLNPVQSITQETHDELLLAIN